MYMTVKQIAEKWGISDRRVRILCSEGKIPGVTREGRSWKIPEDAKKPEDDVIRLRKICWRRLIEREQNWTPGAR